MDAKAPASPDRILRWDGCVNVRDLGGLPLAGGGETAYRVVVRADWLPGLNEAGRRALVEYGVSLPDHLKIQDGWSKFAVREAMRGLMPERVRLRRSKLGFAAPDRSWLAATLRPQVTALIAGDMRAAKYIDVPALRRWYADSAHVSVTTESYLGLFRVLSLEMWMRAFDM